MGMLLRHRPEPDTLTTTECFGKPEKEKKKPVEKEKPQTLAAKKPRGRQAK